jgi:hypothetical protein
VSPVPGSEKGWTEFPVAILSRCRIQKG